MGESGWGNPERIGSGKGVGWAVRLGETKAELMLYDTGELLVTDTSEDQVSVDADCRPALTALLRAGDCLPPQQPEAEALIRYARLELAARAADIRGDVDAEWKARREMAALRSTVFPLPPMPDLPAPAGA